MLVLRGAARARTAPRAPRGIEAASRRNWRQRLPTAKTLIAAATRNGAGAGDADDASTSSTPQPPTPPQPRRLNAADAVPAPAPLPRPPPSTGRLFSNLDEDLKHSPGSVLDAAALVAGTTIGAGVLAIPSVTAGAGFAAAAPALLGAWAFSVASGLLLAEASLSFLCSTGRGGGSLLSLTRDFLGVGPSRVAGFCYVFLHQALLVAYISRGAEVLSAAAEAAFSPSSSSSDASALLLPLSAVLFTSVLGSACYALPAKKLDEANSVLVGGVVASFAALLAVALGSSGSTSGAPPPDAAAAAASSSFFPLDLAALSRADWAQLPPALPVLALAFVFQNTVSVVVSSLEGDAKKIRTAIVAGTVLPLFMFLAWDAVSLGSSSSGGGGGVGGGIGASIDPVAALSASSPLAGPLVATFSMLALITSFVGFVLGLTDFLADALPTERRRAKKEEEQRGEGAGGEKKHASFSLRSLLPLNPSGRARAPVPYALTLLPPLFGAVAVPGAFLSALSAAGTYGVMALFGVLPAALAAVSRRRRQEASVAAGEKVEEALSSPTLVPGGELVFYAVGGIAAAVIANETVSRVMGR